MNSSCRFRGSPVLLQTLERHYICPGETHPITRAVHLSRLASFFSACRECPFRTDAGSLADPALLDALAPGAAHRAGGASIFHRDGVRGVWRNEITRRHAAEIAARFAEWLWRRAHPGDARLSTTGGGGTPPIVAVGHDHRLSAPDIVTGVAESLRLMGCEVVDLGLATGPQLDFSVRHLPADAGILVTGAGFGPSFTGLDFLVSGGVPLSRHETEFQEPAPETFGLDEIAARLPHPCERPARQAPPQRAAILKEVYVRSLLKHFHALRPLRVCAISSHRLLREALERIFSGLPCRLHLAAAPVRQRECDEPSGADLVRLSESVREHHADLGIVLDDDGRSCGVVDERGQMVSHVTLARILMKAQLKEQPGGTVVLAASVAATLGHWADQHGGRILRAGDGAQSVALKMRAEEAVFAADARRLWFDDGGPVRDAIVTLARLLDALSQSDQPLSEIARLAEADGR